MNHLVLDVYKFLGKPKSKLIHFPYWLAYFGGKCFDLLAFITRKKFAISSIRVKNSVKIHTCKYQKNRLCAPVKLEDGIKQTIEYEFVNKVQGLTFSCE